MMRQRREFGLKGQFEVAYDSIDNLFNDKRNSISE